MALLISLSLLLATVLLSFNYPSSTDCTDVSNSTTWKFECCSNNKKHFILEISGQTLNNFSSTNSSEMCVKSNSIQSKSLNFNLTVENGSIKLYENSTVCEGGSTQPECYPNITLKGQPMNFTQGKNECISWTSQNQIKVKINFKCIPNYNSRDLVLNNVSKSWIDALADCQKNHSSLVEISNSTIKNKVTSLLQNYTGSGVWVGLERSVFGCNTQWKWISGCMVENSVLSQNDSANINCNIHCGMIVNVGTTIKWNGANCHDKLPFICQLWDKSPCTCDVTTENSVLSIAIEDVSGSS